MTLCLWPQQDLGPVKRGDIFALGRHRLACIDATDKAAVARLFAGQKPTLVVTSPPYADARDYNDPIPCWDSMMLGALDGHAFANDVQLLVNLGVIHRKGQWMPYWMNWLQLMQGRAWRIVSQYIWNKKVPGFGENQGRCIAAHEYIFHCAKERVLTNCWAPNLSAGRKYSGANWRDGAGKTRSILASGIVPSKRPPSSVFDAYPEKQNRTLHPAVSSRGLFADLIRTWKKTDCVVYDPFGGAVTTLLACESEGVVGLAAEVSPQYVQLAIDRWRKLHPDKPVRRLTARAQD